MKNKLSFFVLLFGLVLASPMVQAAPPEPATVIVEDGDDETGETGVSEPKTDLPQEVAAPTTEELVPVEITTDEEAVETAKGLYSVIVDRNWALAIALGLTLVVFGLRKIHVLDKVPAKAVPWVTAVLSMVGYVVAALMTPGVSVMAALMEGLAAGAAAVGLWEMVLKHMLSKKAEVSESV